MKHSTGRPAALNAVIATTQSVVIDLNGAAAPAYRFLKMLYTPSSGQVNLETYVNLVS